MPEVQLEVPEHDLSVCRLQRMLGYFEEANATLKLHTICLLTTYYLHACTTYYSHVVCACLPTHLCCEEANPTLTMHEKCACTMYSLLLALCTTYYLHVEEANPTHTMYETNVFPGERPRPHRTTIIILNGCDLPLQSLACQSPRDWRQGRCLPASGARKASLEC